jgi:hypothetical protein
MIGRATKYRKVTLVRVIVVVSAAKHNTERIG